MRRPATYDTKHGNAILSCLMERKDSFVTAAQIAAHLRKERIAVSRPTVYRQLEKLARQGVVRKYRLEGTSVLSFQYADPDGRKKDCYRLKCDVCEGIFTLHCGEVGQVSRHIFESHAFRVADTVFYGTCEACLQK